MLRWKTAASVTALALASPAWAGLVITSTSGDERSSVTYLEGKKLRMEHPRQGEEAGHVTMFDGDAHKMVEVDTAARTYRVMTEEQGKELSAKLQAMIAQLPPEQRARAEAAMAKQRSAPSVHHEIRFEPLGSADVVAGYPCQRYRVLRDGKREEEGCFIPWSGRAVARDDLAAFVELSRFFEGFAANAAGVAGPAGAGRWLADEISGAPGFPALLERVGDDGKRTTVHRLVKLERKRVSAELFSIPAGYAEVSSPFLQEGAPRRARTGH